ARGAREFACGPVVTASHNPAPYNGIKLWNPDGMAFDEDQQREIEAALDRGHLPMPSWDHVGSISSRPDLVEQHVESILKDVGTAKLRVVVDCACGATATITPFLLRQMGCDVIAINAQADGHFPGRDPEPLEENLAVLSSTVRAVHADLGIAHDGVAGPTSEANPPGRGSSRRRHCAQTASTRRHGSSRWSPAVRSTPWCETSLGIPCYADRSRTIPRSAK